MNRLKDTRLKIQRAREHLKSLDELNASYLANKPYRTFREYSPSTDRIIRGIAITQDPPEQISLVAADAIQNLRASLDYIAYQLVIANGETPSIQTAFPISDSRIGYTKAVLNRKHPRIDLGHISDNVMKVIDALQPYQRENDAANHPLSLLRELANSDKHRRLYVALAHVSGVDYVRWKLPADLFMRIGGSTPRTAAAGDEVLANSFWFPYPITQQEAEKYLRDSFFVVFEEIGKVRSVPVQKLLEEILQFVEKTVIPGFEPFLS